ncbi:MAG: tetratricopeptide repeat protein [Halobacteriovoraceae bacterium]|nr:tetratricopeptide repeat protein [Halobacteriovoraceae bacterium]MCB9094232.1 tetratricopeptide repeat protein [Halobacteriovoraceae bacterium]
MAKHKNTIVNPAEVLESHHDDLKKYTTWGIVGVVIAVIAGVSVGLYQRTMTKTTNALASDLYEYNQKVLKEFESDKIDIEKFYSQTMAVIEELGDSEVFFPYSKSVYQKLNEKNEYGKITELFKKLRSKTTSSNVAHYTFSQYLAVSLENQKNYDEAISILKESLSSPFKLEEKVYLDLGRLYYLTGDQQKAKENFHHVIDKFPNSQMAKYAKAYLAKYGLEMPEEKPAQSTEEK